jgi:indolepyruvate decarboxylase
MADEILKRIEVANAPVAVVDVEIRRYGVEDKIATLARKLSLPLVTTFMGRGLLEHAPDVVAGTYFGAAVDPVITTLVEDADLVLMLGVILSDTNFALSNRAPDPRRSILASSREVQIGYHSLLPQHTARRSDRRIAGARQAERAATATAETALDLSARPASR